MSNTEELLNSCISPGKYICRGVKKLLESIRVRKSIYSSKWEQLIYENNDYYRSDSKRHLGIILIIKNVCVILYERDRKMYNPDKDYQYMLDKLNSIRKQKNMSKYALAKATGMSSSSMSNLLNGKTKPYLYNMLLICNAMHISMEELLQNKNYNCENEEALISAYRNMTPQKQQMLQVFTDMLLKYDGIV